MERHLSALKRKRPLHHRFSEIIVRRGEGRDQLERQRRLGEALNRCRPNVETLSLPTENHAEFCAEVVGDRLGVPVRMVSLGPTEDHKVFL